MNHTSRLHGQRQTRQETSQDTPPNTGSHAGRLWRMFGLTLAFVIFALVAVSVSL